MPRRVKDEEKIEMIIRGLLKQEDNRRCINCNSLGPQYVCTTFWTFVCTNCSGVHREFNHRVKSVSMAKFNEEEIMALQAGGNERAKQIYFKTWDLQRSTYPDSSNLQRLREFVNHVYIDRRYAGDNSSNKLSMVKLDSRSNSCEWPSEKPGWGRREDFFQRSSFERASRSGRDDYCSSERSSPSHNNKVLNLKDFLEERSPRHSQETPRSSSLRSRSTRFEIVDDRFREDGSVKTYERNSIRESRSGSMSPCSQSSRTMSLPASPPVRVIVGEKVPVLRIEGPSGGGKDAEGSARVEKAAAIPGPSGGNEKQKNAARSSSLIDFLDADSEFSSSPLQPQAQPTASNTNNESSWTASPSNQTAANVPDFFLEWSSPTASPSAGTKVPEIPNNSGALANTSTNNDQPFHTKNPIVQEIQMHQRPTRATSVESLSNQYWSKQPPSNDLRPVRSVSLEQPSQAVNPGEGSAPSARKEIPQDLFSSNFTPFNQAVAGWLMPPAHEAAYGMQFHPPTMSAAAVPNPPKPRNPFDIGDDRFQVQAETFSSMSSLQGALPNMPTSTALESQTLPYATALPSQPHLSPYGMNIPQVPGAYMGQLSNNMPLTRPQGNANFGRTEDAFSSLNPIRQTSGTGSVPAPPTSQLPRAGNPFG